MDERFLADPRGTQPEASRTPVGSNGMDLTDAPVSEGLATECIRVVTTDAVRRLSWRRRQTRPWMRAPRQSAADV